jgi:phage terminase large subunit-like protein
MARDKRPDQLPERDCSTLTLAEYIEHASGGSLVPPYHLGEYFDLCSHLVGGELHICVSMPPQHAKTTTIAHAIAWTLHRFPSTLFGYGSYAKLFSANRTEEIRDIYINSGGRMKADHNRKDDWRTDQGGGCLAFSPGSGIAGNKMHTIVFDDFVENEIDLDTEEKRKAIHRDIDRATQRLWVGGSVVCIGTRWHPEDPIGHLLGRGYTELNLPAVREIDGEEIALWPDVKPIEWLNSKRTPSSKEYVGDYAWQTQYQGRPVPPEGSIFGKPRFYTELPPGAEIVSIGFDFGYGPEGTSDHSVAVVLARLGDIYYVHEVVRVRSSLAEMARAFRAIMLRYPTARHGCYMGGNEKGILNLLFQEDSLLIERMPAKHNKYTRSQRCAKAWQTGRILVRSDQVWSASFAREVEYFTGNERGKDDQVDALVSGFDLVELSAPVGWAGAGFTFGSAVM